MAQKKDLIGKRIGLLTVVKELETKIYSNGKKNYQYECLCDCGNVVKRNYQSLNRKNVNQSNCGCQNGQHKGNRKHGLSTTPTYNSWKAMIARCFDKNNIHYSNYGGRGITIEDDRWLDFETFYEDMRERPRGKSIDRINNERGYCKENCRWATNYEQSINKRKDSRYKLTEADVYTIRWKYECDNESISGIATEFGVTRGTIRDIVNRKTYKYLT